MMPEGTGFWMNSCKLPSQSLAFPVWPASELSRIFQAPFQAEFVPLTAIHYSVSNLFAFQVDACAETFPSF